LEKIPQSPNLRSTRLSSNLKFKVELPLQVVYNVGGDNLEKVP